MSTARLVEVDAPGSIPVLARLLKRVPRPTILVSFVRPYKDLRPRLEQEGVGLADVFFIDATPNPHLEAFRPDAFFIGSPSLLERVGIVCEKVLPRLGGKAHMVIHDHNAVHSYNGTEITRQFLHHLITQSHRNQCDLDILVTDPDDALCAMVDQTTQLETMQ